MNKKIERTLLLLIDFFTINAAWLCFYIFRMNTGWFDAIMTPDLWVPMLIIYLFWLLLYIFVGLYRSWFAVSRFDELFSIFKSTFIGVMILFFTIYLDDQSHGVESGARMLILAYLGMLIGFVSLGRLAVRALQRRLLINGIGRRNTLIIGTGPSALDVKKELESHRGLGLDVTGFLAIEDSSAKAKPILGKREDFLDVLERHSIKEVVFALDEQHDDIVIDLLVKGEEREIGYKIVPDLFEILSGQAKTMQLYGVPLIDINPTLMPAWEEKVKRLLDLIVAGIILILTLPVIILTAISIKLNSKGPVFYKQQRCGLNGKLFKIVKFRSMYTDAEKLTGPVWSPKDDPRVTPVGKFIRKVRIDEIPQMWNIFKGEMSLIGPRPERPFFVEKFAEEIPYYKRRLKVRPGVTGWAQVKHKYDESVDDVKTKLKYDLFYIENMSLRMDLKILFRTIFVVLFGKGHFD